MSSPKIDLRQCVWSSHLRAEGGVVVSLRSREFHTGVIRELSDGAALFLMHNPIAFHLLCEELFSELIYRCEGLSKR